MRGESNAAAAAAAAAAAFVPDAGESLVAAAAPIKYRSRITHHASRITHQASRITHHASRITWATASMARW
jgi:hypothetical protein